MRKTNAFVQSLFLQDAQQSDKIPWREDRKLRWSDFQQRPDTKSPFAAMSVTGIHIKYSSSLSKKQVVLDYSVESFFEPKKSWSKPEKQSQHILNHEQIHFDITELHARKLRKNLQNGRFSRKVKNEVEQIYLRIEGQRKAMQQKFDAETKHSLNVEKQLVWERFISKELIKYDTWK